MKVVCKFSPRIGFSLVKFRSLKVPKKMIIRLSRMIGMITLFAFMIALKPILLATPMQPRKMMNIRYVGVLEK